MAVSQAGSVPIPGASVSPPPAKNELVRIEQARPVAPVSTTPPVVASNEKLAKPTPRGKKGRKKKLESPAPQSTPVQAVIAQNKPVLAATPTTVASGLTPPSALNVPVATPAAASKVPDVATGAIAQRSPLAMATPVPVLSAKSCNRIRQGRCVAPSGHRSAMSLPWHLVVTRAKDYFAVPDLDRTKIVRIPLIQ